MEFSGKYGSRAVPGRIAFFYYICNRNVYCWNYFFNKSVKCNARGCSMQPVQWSEIESGTWEKHLAQIDMVLSVSLT